MSRTQFCLRTTFLLVTLWASSLPAQNTDELTAARQRAAETPRDVAALLRWAEAAMAGGEPIEALQASSSARALAPADPAVAPVLARAQLMVGRLIEARATIESMPLQQQAASGLRNSAQAIEIYQSVDKLYAAAEQSGQVDDIRLLTQRLREAAELDPKIPVISRTLGFILLDKLQQPQSALPWLEQANALTPDDTETQTLLARARLEMGQFDQALQLYDQLDAAQSDDVGLQLNVAAALIGARRWNDAQNILQQILNSDAQNDRAVQLLAELRRARTANTTDGLPSDSDVVSEAAQQLLVEANRLLTEGDRTKCVPFYRQAAERLCQALAIEPNSHTLNQTLGYVYLEKLGEPETAYVHLCRALQLQPTKLDTQKLLALAALRSGRTCEAIDRFRAVLRRDPQDTWMLVNLGRGYGQAGDYDAALDIYQRVLSRDHTNFTARLGIAEIEGWRGLSHRPRSRAEQLVCEQPSNPEALNLLGDLYRWDWDLSAAATHYQRATTADPSGRAGQQGLAEIAKTKAYVATTDGYQFQDNFGFRRSFYGGGLRMSLSDRAYLTSSFTLWDYQQGGIDLQRTDAAMELEYHFNRHLQANARFLNFDYSNDSADQAGSLSLKYSPLATIDLYASAAWGEPAVLTDINIPLLNIRMNNYATGYDVDLTDHWSSQGSFSYADYYDGNERRFGTTQMSYRPDLCRDLFLRVKYEDLSFADQTAVYFSPDSFKLLRLITDYSLPVYGNLALDTQGEAIDVLGSGWGWGYRVGPSWHPGDRFEARAAYFATSIPGAAPFSGDGFTYSASLRF